MRSLKPTLILTLLTTAIICGGLYWRGNDSQYPVEQQSSKPNPTKPAIALHPTEPPTERENPFASEFKATAQKTIDALTAKYSGKNLEMWLVRAAKFYGAQGIEPTKEFIMALPPGDYGKVALVEACECLVSVAPDMITWLSANKDKLSQQWSFAGSDRLIALWSKENWDAATKFVSEKGILELREQTFWLDSLLGNNDAPRGERLLQYIESIANTEVKSAASVSMPAIQARLSSSPNETVRFITALKNPALQTTALTAIASILPTLGDRTGLMSSLLAADYPDKNQWISRYCMTWAQADVNSSMKWTNGIKDNTLRDRIIDDSWKTIAQYDPDAAKQWINSIADDKIRQNAINNLELAINKTASP